MARVLVTTLGRLHFVNVMTALVKAGVDAVLFMGWVVKNPKKSWGVRLAALIDHRESLIWGFEKRSVPELEGRVIGDFFTEFVEFVWRRTVERMSNRMKRHGGRIGFLGEKIGYWGGKLVFALHGYRTRRILRKGKFDVFHVRSGFGAGGAIEMAKKVGTKVLIDHSAGAPQFIIEQVYGRKFGPTSNWYVVMQDCNKADILMVDCDWVKETFLMYGYPEEKIRVVYMGLDEKFNGLKKWNEDLTGIGHSAEKPLRVVFTGGFAYHKGNEYFLGAVEKLLDSGLHFKFMAIGDQSISDEQRKKYARAIEAMEFTGHLPQDEMVKRMLDSQVYLFPSLSEGCAKSAYEAMSMGLCVVCTKETGLPLCDGDNGFLIEKRSSDSIAKKLLWLVERPERIRSTGLAGVEEMKKHTWARYAEEVKAVYQELIGGKV